MSDGVASLFDCWCFPTSRSATGRRHPLRRPSAIPQGLLQVVGGHERVAADLDLAVAVADLVRRARPTAGRARQAN
jgi:hypothetical protein